MSQLPSFVAQIASSMSEAELRTADLIAAKVQGTGYSLTRPSYALATGVPY